MQMKGNNVKCSTRLLIYSLSQRFMERRKKKVNYLNLIDSIQAKSAETPNGDKLIGLL